MNTVEGEVRMRVRYKDTDKMGVMHHSNYVNCYESARTELLRERGISYREMEERGVMLPVREVYMNYLSPAYYDDLLTVRIRVAEEPRVKLVFDHEIYNEAGELINTGKVVLVFVNAETRRPCRAPRWFLELFGY